MVNRVSNKLENVGAVKLTNGDYIGNHTPVILFEGKPEVPSWKERKAGDFTEVDTDQLIILHGRFANTESVIDYLNKLDNIERREFFTMFVQHPYKVAVVKQTVTNTVRLENG